MGTDQAAKGAEATVADKAEDGKQQTEGLPELGEYEIERKKGVYRGASLLVGHFANLPVISQRCLPHCLWF